jgi:signal transduction histidine kinase/ligand-binding sensor domain-containing protein/CheY-like chemotaxis protein
MFRVCHIPAVKHDATIEDRRSRRGAWLPACLCAGLMLLARPSLAEFPALVLEHLTTDDGLPQGTVLAMLQDSQGFMWFGTEDGLVRYDGHELTRYAYSRTANAGLPANYIQGIVEDAGHDLWIAVNDGGLVRWNRATDRFTVYRHDPKDPSSLASDLVCAILVDDRGRVWAGTRDAGVDILNPLNGRIEHMRHDPANIDSLADNRVQALSRGADGTIWVGTQGGLDRTQSYGSSFVHYRHFARDAHSLSSDDISQVLEEADGTVWISTVGGGIDRIDRTGKVTSVFRHDPKDSTSLASDEVNALAEDRQGRLWAGTSDGLDLLDRLSGKFTHYRHDASDAGSLRDSWIKSLYEDGSGLLWIGTREGGVSRWNPRSWELGARRPSWLGGKPVTAFADAADHKIWVAALDGGLMLFDPKNGEFADLDAMLGRRNAIGSRRIMALQMDRQRTLWAGLMDGGLRKLTLEGHVDEVPVMPGNPRGLSAAGVMAIYEAYDGKIWVGTHGGGANILDPNSGLVRQLPFDSVSGAISSANVTAFAEDHSGNIWIGTQGGGLDLARSDGTVYKVFRHDPQRPDSLSANTVFAITVDSSGRVWIGTDGGGMELVLGSSAEPDAVRFENISRADGLTSDTIYGILPDLAGRLWLSGNAGLMRFDPQSRVVKTFHVEQGAQGEEFDYGAALRLRDGRFCFGGPSGFNVFDPAHLTEKTRPPRLVLTRVEVLGMPMQSERPYWLLDRIDVDSHASILSLDFGALEFTSAKRNRLSYRMAGLTDHWIDLGTQRRVTLTNLDAGDHILEVRGASADSVWSDSPLRLRIHRSPAPWKSNSAFAGYALALIGAIFTVIWRQRHKISLAQEAQHRLEAVVEARTQDLRESNRLLEDAAKAKSDFLARMTHELRTPMNGVVGMTELLERTGLNANQAQFTKTIRASADVLLQIVNDLLDLSKAQARKIELERLPVDLVALLEESIALFEAQAAEKGLELTACPPERIGREVVGDPMRLRQIIWNLIGNAVKFTERGQVVVVADIVEVTDDRAIVEISVADSGIGMTAAAAQKIFDPFTQADESTSRRFGGTGLGLAICRELAMLMDGSISVQSQPGVGSTFKVRVALRLAGERIQAPTQQLTGQVGIRTRQTVLAEALARHARSFGLRVAGADAASGAHDAGAAAMHDVAANPAALDAADLLVIDGATEPDLLQAQLAISGAGRRPLVAVVTKAEAESLGLAGRIEVDAIVHKPVKRADFYRACARALGKPAALLQVEAPGGACHKPGTGSHVLVVDDEPVNAAVAQGYLAALGCTSVWVESGPAALSRCSVERFDLILMDVSMPGMDGVAATGFIRGREGPNRNVPIVALTAHDSKSHRARCLAAGMDDLLEKPYTLHSCAALIDCLVHRDGAVSAAPCATAIGDETGFPGAGALRTVNQAVISSLRSLPARGNGDLFTRLADLFRETASADLAALRTALAAMDWHAAGAICHKLKSSAEYVGAAGFAEGLRALEARCKTGGTGDAMQRFEQLEAAFPALVDELGRFMMRATA